jgi:hypothetical protein
MILGSSASPGVPRVLSWGATMAAALAILTASPALAARPSHGSGGGTSSPTGNDVSYPQCGASFPSGQAFGIVGVNDGLANSLNPCLGPSSSYPKYTQSELYWAVADSSGKSSQPRASLYVNTADPGNGVSDWPIASSSGDPYGSCTASGTPSVGQDSTACAWQYGYDKLTQDILWLTSAATAIDKQESSTPVLSSPAAYPWWLDVETANSWQSGTLGLAMNVADLQGMVAALTAVDVTQVGIYSTSYQWGQVTGGSTYTAGTSLVGLADWIPGARNLSGAVANCQLSSFTGGVVELTQWFSRPYDSDYAC